MTNKFIGLVLLGLIVFPLISAYSDSVYVGDYDLDIEYEAALSDDVFSLIVHITNDDSEAHNLSFGFEEDDPFEFVNDDDWDVLVDSGETVSKTFRIEVDNDAGSKNYDLEFDLSDGDDNWDDEFEIKVINDQVELKLGEILSSPQKIVPGDKEVELEVVVKNTGDYEASDLVARLILPEGFEKSGSYSDTVHVGDLDEGESETLTFYFDVDEVLGEGDHVAQLVLEYEDDGDDEETSLDLEIDVFGIAQFKIVSMDVLTEGVYAGETAKVKIGILNVGGEMGEDVSLKVYERSDQPFEFVEKSVYVGSLDVGQTGYAVFEFDADRDASEIGYLLDFQVRSISGNDVLVDDLTQNIVVSEKAFNSMNYIYAGVVGLIVLFSLVFVVVRRF